MTTFTEKVEELIYDLKDDVASVENREAKLDWFYLDKQFREKTEAILKAHQAEISRVLERVTIGGRGGTEVFVENVPIERYKEQLNKIKGELE